MTLVLALCAAARAQTTGDSPEKIRGSLEGTVTNDSGGGVSGVVVSINAPAGNSQTMVTDAEGRFRIAGLKRNRETTAVHNESNPLPGGKSTATGSGEEKNVSLRGTVTEVSGTAVLGVIVTVQTTEGNSRTAITDTDGSFRIAGLKWDKTLDVFTLPRGSGLAGDNSSQIKFWSLQGLMFATAVAAAETTQNCIQSGSCTAIPSAFHSRAAMYGVGLPAAAGIALLSYEMKKHHNRWWYLPPTLVIAADGVLTFHSARASQ
jgi:hypothetical protein